MRMNLNVHEEVAQMYHIRSNRIIYVYASMRVTDLSALKNWTEIDNETFFLYLFFKINSIFIWIPK